MTDANKQLQNKRHTNLFVMICLYLQYYIYYIYNILCIFMIKVSKECSSFSHDMTIFKPITFLISTQVDDNSAFKVTNSSPFFLVPAHYSQSNFSPSNIVPPPLREFGNL